MIVTKPSDLYWRPGPLPAPEPNLVVLAWVAGELANHLEKAYVSQVRGEPTWAVGYHIPVERIGEVRFWAILRDEPYRGYVPLAETDDGLTLGGLIERLGVEGGALVSAADCSTDEISLARGRGDVYTDRKAFAFVRRLPAWLQRHSRTARHAHAEPCEAER